MKWVEFHHPDISWPVVRRRAGIEILEMMDLVALFLTRGGWGVLKKSCYPNHAAYRNAISRLRRQGLIVHRPGGSKVPELTLSDAGRNSLPVYFHPERFWDAKWNKTWYLLVYDVPEKNRAYRNVLREFLKRMRMGCLQQSVWISPRDIRPDFDDLAAASLHAFAYLFEAKTVLGLPSRRVVEDAWRFDQLADVQERYCFVVEQNLDRLKAKRHSAEELATLMRVALNAYHSAMVNDPLLPRALHPGDYQGRRVLRLHRCLFEEINQQH